jgi:hypothetical protein
MDQIEDDEDNHEGENYGDNAATVPCLAVAGNLPFRGLNVTMRGNGAIGEPAERTAGSEEYETHSVGGRTHLHASLAVVLAQKAWAYVEFSPARHCIGQENRRSVGNDLIMAKQYFPLSLHQEGEGSHERSTYRPNRDDERARRR